MMNFGMILLGFALVLIGTSKTNLIIGKTQLPIVLFKVIDITNYLFIKQTFHHHNYSIYLICITKLQGLK